MSTEFSRRCDVIIFKDEPDTFDEFAAKDRELGITSPEILQANYRVYRERLQPFRWHAVGANNEVIAHGESYHNLDDCLNAIDLLCGDDTTMYRMPTFGEDRSQTLLRYGAKDRNSQGGAQ